MNITDDEALGFMDRLPEWLRQADLTNFGSRIEVVFVRFRTEWKSRASLSPEGKRR